MNIRFGHDITATIEGDAVKTLSCESCNHDYSYQMVREGAGEGFNWLGLTRRTAGTDTICRYVSCAAIRNHGAIAVCTADQTSQHVLVDQASSRWLGLVASAIRRSDLSTCCNFVILFL